MRSLTEIAESKDEIVAKLLEDLKDNAEARMQRLAWVDRYLRGALGGVREGTVLQAEIKSSQYEKAVSNRHSGLSPHDLQVDFGAAGAGDGDGEKSKIKKTHKFTNPDENSRVFSGDSTRPGAPGDEKSILDFEPNDNRFRWDINVGVHPNLKATQMRHMALSDIVGQARIEVLKKLVTNPQYKDQLYVVKKTENGKYREDCGADPQGFTKNWEEKRVAWSEKLSSGTHVFHYEKLADVSHPDFALDKDNLRLCLNTQAAFLMPSFRSFPAPLQELLKNRLEDRHVALYLENPLQYGTHVLLDDDDSVDNNAMSPLHRAETYCRSIQGRSDMEACGALTEAWTYEVKKEDE